MGPAELEFKKNKQLSWSQQMQVVVAVLLQAQHQAWIEWVISVSPTSSALLSKSEAHLTRIYRYSRLPWRRGKKWSLPPTVYSSRAMARKRLQRMSAGYAISADRAKKPWTSLCRLVSHHLCNTRSKSSCSKC